MAFVTYVIRIPRTRQLSFFIINQVRHMPLFGMLCSKICSLAGFMREPSFRLPFCVFRLLPCFALQWNCTINL